MRLRALRIQRLPGIHPGFTLDGLAPGVNVIVGPNAGGKSSLVRALRAALYRDAERDAGVHVEATFDDEATGEVVTAERTGASVQWQRAGQPAEPPPLPEDRFLRCYTLSVEDLLDDDHATDAAIAEYLTRELAGGYDLRAVREAPPFRLKQNHGREDAKALQTADRGLRQRQQERETLARDEAGLDELRERKAAAEAARHEADLFDRALELLEQRRDHRRLTEQLADFPEGMDRLRGDEGDTLERLRAQLRQHRSERQGASERRAAAAEALAQSGLDDAALDEATLADQRRLIDRLRQTETQRDQQRDALTRAQAALARATEALGGDGERAVRSDPATVQTVERELEAKRALDPERQRLAQELEQLPAASDDDADPETLRAGRRELLQWLAAPRTPPWTPLRLLGGLAVLVAGAGGIGLAGVEVHLGWLGLLAPLAVGAVLLLWSGRGARDRRAAEQRFNTTGLAGPAAWRREAVAERMGVLDQEVVKAERLARAHERRGEAERALAARDEELEKIRARLRAIAAEVGFDPEILDASLPRWLKLVADCDQAHHQAAEIEAEHRRLKRSADELRARVIAFLDAFGMAPAATDADAEILSDRLERLSERVRQRDEARRSIDEADREIARLDRTIAECCQEIDQLFACAGLAGDDDDGLRQRLERLGAWRRLQDELRDVRGREADREQRLGERSDLVARVDSDDEAGLRSGRDAKREQANELEGLIQEITRIEGEIERAGRERALESARAAYQQAHNALHDRLDEALFAEAGRFLLEHVDAEHEQAVQPAALARARDWFARFTRHQYELIFSRDAADGFTARETATGTHRRLAELSSGTRTQLLLAVRMAFARDAERGTRKLPLVLDEALTTADPERFRAAAQSLTLLAQDDDRQVFYLTAQPADVAFWAEFDPDVTVIDLAARRGQAVAIDDVDALTPPERRVVPAPDGRSAAEYAVALGVPGIDPWRDPGDIHLFHLLRDDLALLHRLIDLGVDRLGPLESLLASPAVASTFSEASIQRLRARAEGARAWSAAWRQGRGRPVDRAGLADAGVLSDRMLDEVAQLAEAVDGDGATLIQRLSDGEVRNFRRHKREALEAWLEAHGYICGQEPLSRADVELRVAAALSEHVPAGTDANEEARALVESLETGMGAERSTPES